MLSTSGNQAGSIDMCLGAGEGRAETREAVIRIHWQLAGQRECVPPAAKQKSKDENGLSLTAEGV